MIPVSRPSTGAEELEAVEKVLQTGWLGLGEKTFEFEQAVKNYIGCQHVIAVNSGTSALHLALEALGVGPGDEVIVPSLTFVGSVQAVLATGATPVFCESRETDLLIDINDVERKTTRRTKAIMPVHYCGNPCDMDHLLALAGENHSWIIEDAAHAFGSTYKGRKIGSFGHATCFSFDPIKNVTCGEGGAVLVQDESITEVLRRKRVLGIDKEAWHRHQNARPWFYEVTSRGFRYHMPNFCAAIGLVQLKKVDEFIRRRREICRLYDAAFSSLKVIRPLTINYDEAAPHIYIVRVLNGHRDAFMDFLKERGIGTGVHYIANHLQPAFKAYVKEPLPLASQLSEQIVTLPLYYDMSDSDAEKVIKSVLSFSKQSQRLLRCPPKIAASSSQ